MANDRIRILIADDSDPVRNSLVEVLYDAGRFDVVAEAVDGRDAVLMARRYRPDVVLMDVSMPRVNGEDATRLILGDRPGTRVVALSIDASEKTAQQMREAGAAAYITKDAPTDDLIAAIRAAATPRSIG